MTSFPIEKKIRKHLMDSTGAVIAKIETIEGPFYKTGERGGPPLYIVEGTIAFQAKHNTNYVSIRFHDFHWSDFSIGEHNE